VCWNLDVRLSSLYMRIYLTASVLISDLRKIRVAPDRPESNYCVSRRVSVTVGGENCLMRIFLIYIHIIWMVKSSGMKWARRVARMREKRNVYRVFLWGNTKGRDDLEDLGLDGRMILK